jgi:hypothetical protein
MILLLHGTVRRRPKTALRGQIVRLSWANQWGLDHMFYAMFFIAGLIAGFLACWAVARHLLKPVKHMLEAAGHNVGGQEPAG